MRRRTLLGGLAGGALVAAGAGLARSWREREPQWGPRAGSVAPEGVPDVAIVKGEPGPAVRAAVDLLGGMGTFVRRGDRVVIKPNCSFPHAPELGAITEPRVTLEVVKLCLEAGAARVVVLDNTTSDPTACLQRTRDALRSIGFGGVVAPKDARQYRKVPIPDAVAMRETDIALEVLEADVLIVVPAAKSHGQTGVSLAIKGMMGLNWDRFVMHQRYDLDASIVDLASILKPDLALVDATRVLSSNGPAGPGLLIPAGMILASRDMVAVDAATVAEFTWSGVQARPYQVAHVRLAAERGLGRMDLENLRVERRVLS